MALLARPDDILTAEVRTRIRNRQNIVSTVTIITLRRFRIAKLRDLAMVRVKVRLGNRFVATAALRHDLQFEARRINPANRVRRMAIAAHRQRLVGLSDFLRMDACFKLPFDSMVTSSARLGNVARIHAGE